MRLDIQKEGHYKIMAPVHSNDSLSPFSKRPMAIYSGKCTLGKSCQRFQGLLEYGSKFTLISRHFERYYHLHC